MPRLSRRSLLRSTLVAAAALLLPFAPSALAQDTSDWNPTMVNRPGYGVAPVWSDEFNGASLDRSKWTPEETAWWHNGELQYYTADEANCNTADGKLRITATDTPKGGRQYTSARIDTQHTMQFKHGLFAARIKLTKGQGLWPAFWLFGTGPKYSEIDIAESAGGTSAAAGTGSGDDTAYGTILHFSVKDKPTDEVTKLPGGSFHTPDGSAFADNYYVMWLEWTETEVWAGLDNDHRKIVDDLSQLEAYKAHMYIILNVAVGGHYPQAPDATTQFPQTMSVDWVRVWNKDGEDILKPMAGAALSTGGGGGATPPTDASSGSDDSGSGSGTVTPGGDSSSGGGSSITPGGGVVGDSSSAATTDPSVASSTGGGGSTNGDSSSASSSTTSSGSSSASSSSGGSTKPPPSTTTPDTTVDPALGTGANAAAAGATGSLITAALTLMAGWMARII